MLHPILLTQLILTLARSFCEGKRNFSFLLPESLKKTNPKTVQFCSAYLIRRGFVKQSTIQFAEVYDQQINFTYSHELRMILSQSDLDQGWIISFLISSWKQKLVKTKKTVSQKNWGYFHFTSFEGLPIFPSNISPVNVSFTKELVFSKKIWGGGK